MSTTANQIFDRRWDEVTNVLTISNVSNEEIEVWVGTVAPTDSDNGHILKRGKGISSDSFQDGDRFWVRSITGKSKACITKKS